MQELVIRIGADTKDLSGALAKAKGDLRKFEVAAGKGSKALANTGKGAANAVPALNEFSRVIQDAPFGIQGVANNITQLTQNFGYLKNSAGGTKAALSAMLKTLAGPAGILLAVSAVTSLLVAFGDKLSGAASETNKLIDAQKELTGSAQTQLTTYSKLLSIARDNNRSLQERQKALDKVNEKSGKYIGNLELESINSEEVAKKTDGYSKALLRNAKIKGIQNRLSELYTKQFEIENQELGKQLGLWDKTVVGIKSYLGIADSASDGFNRALANQKEALKETEAGIKSLTKAFENILSEDIADDFSVFTNVKTKVDKEAAKTEIRGAVESISADLTSKPIDLSESLKIDTPAITEKLNMATEAVLMWNEKMRFLAQESANILQSGALDAISGIGQAIGNAFATGANLAAALGGVLLSTLGDIAIRLGKTAIGIGVAMKAIKLSFKSPGAAIAAGVALVAIGGALKGAASIVQGGGGSGDVGGAGSSSGSNFSSSTSIQARGNGGGRVIFEIAGDKLIGVLNNSQNANNRIGDNFGIVG